MCQTWSVNGKDYLELRFLGKGKGGYSYLVTDGTNQYVLKQIHHEPCSYYHFGNKLEAECYDYERIRKAGIRIPKMLAVDAEKERILKEYIDGKTVYEWIRDGDSDESLLEQIREMAAFAKEAGLNIDYFPTNFVVQNGLIWYIDYECNNYMEEWNFENWGMKYWSRTKEFDAYLKSREDGENGV